MLPESTWILLLIALLLAFATLLAFCFYRYQKLKKRKSSKDLQIKRQDYEDRLLNEIHERYGYSVDKTKIFNTIVDSISTMVPYSVTSYVIIGRKKLRFRHHLYDNTSRDYLDEMKNILMDSIGGRISSISLKSHVEETITGNFVDNTVSNRPLSQIEVPVFLNNECVGVLAVSSKNSTAYTNQQKTLVKTAIDRVFSEVGRLQNLIDTEKTKLEMMVENMNTGVILIDEEFNVATINSSLVRILSLKEKSRVTIFDVVSRFAPDFSLDTVINKTIEDNTPSLHEEIKVGEKYLDVVVIPIVGTVDKKGAGILVRDVTQEHAFDQMRDDFTSMLVHELRSPLTVVLDSADLIIKRKDDLQQKQVNTLLEQIRNSSKSLLDLVNDLLDTAKLEAGKLEIKKSPNDINNLLIDEVNYFSHLAANKKIKISVDTDTSIGTFPFDYAKIKQVMNNLISNAIKFTDQGEVKVTSRILGSFVEVRVADTGVGIPDEEKIKLFDKYSQVSKSISSDQKGTGLGLVISKGIIDAHGGEVKIEDNAVVGSVFSFTLPVKDDGNK